MKEYLSAREIAESALPEVPSTESAVVRMAKRENWAQHPGLTRARNGQGGGLEYSIRLLPTLAQIEWSRRHLKVEAPLPAPAAANDDVAEDLTERGMRERDARLAIVSAFQTWGRGLTLGQGAKLYGFATRYEMGSVQVDGWIKELIPNFSPRSLHRWVKAVQKGQAGALAVDRGLARKGTGVLDRANGGAVRTFILALIAHQPHLSCHHIRDQVQAKFGTALEVGRTTKPLPPVRAFQRCVAELKATHRVELTKATNPDLYRSTMAPAGTGTYRYISQPNALWMIDASPVDVLCTDGRYSMYGCIDIATRRLVVTISKTPRASAVALLMRKAIMAWGVPKTIKTDNGSDFVARDTKRLFDFLNIEPDVSDAYSPQQKGHIERAIRTFQHDVGPQLPGFIGHSVADRKAIESRKSLATRRGESEAETFGVAINSVELQRYVDQWVELIYQHRPHAGLDKQTPFLKAAESTAPIRRVDERALDLLLMPVAGKDGQRTTTKFGVRIDGYHYQTPSILPGTAVFVRMDPMDAGRALCFRADGAEFLGEALCAELRGIDPADLQKAARAQQAEIISRNMAAAKREQRELGKRPLIEAALRIAAERVPNVVVLPKREETHSTPQIAAALDAMRPASPSRVSDHLKSLHDSLLAELATPEAPAANVTALRPTLTPSQLYRKAMSIEAMVARGEDVPPEDLIWLGGFKASATFQTQKELDEAFGGSGSL